MQGRSVYRKCIGAQPWCVPTHSVRRGRFLAAERHFALGIIDLGCPGYVSVEYLEDILTHP